MVYQYEISQHVLPLYRQSCGAKREREPKTGDTQTHGSSTCAVTEVTQLRPVTQRKAEPAGCASVGPPGPHPCTTLHMLAVRISPTSQKRPEPRASEEPRSVQWTHHKAALICHKTTLMSPSVTHPGRSTHLPSPALPPQITRSSFLHT